MDTGCWPHDSHDCPLAHSFTHALTQHSISSLTHSLFQLSHSPLTPLYYIMSALSPVVSIKDSCHFVNATASHVHIDDEAVQRVASEWSASNISTLKQSITWDADNWHYCADVESLGPLTCQYIFVMDSLNFCFWPTEGFEYEHLALGLKAVLEQDATAFNADKLVSLTVDTLRGWFPGWDLPNADERVLRLRELGQALLDDFDGLAENLVAKAQRSAPKLVQLIIQYLPGFRDTSIYRGRLIHFYKRAQILVGDIWAAYGIREKNIKGDDKSQSIYQFHDMQALTMFADYRVPQILRNLGIFVYSDQLASDIDAKKEIPFGSDEEIEIRACTIVAVEMLQKALCQNGVTDVIEIEIDWLLWQQGEKIKDEIAPHHRTLTIYY